MKILIIALSLIGFINAAHASETIGEKVEVKTNDVKREVKKVVHRGQETICEKNNKNCFAKKVGHRASETKDYAKDKVSEGANIINEDK